MTHLPDSPTARLVHISDVHFGAEDHEALSLAAEWINHNMPDAVVIAGDLTQSGRRSEFKAAADWLETLRPPCLVAPGNHDTPALHLPHHLPTRFLKPFALYERYLSRWSGVGRLMELCEGRIRLTALNTARGIQGRLNWADGVIALDDLQSSLSLLAEGRPDAWRILVCHHPLREPRHSHISVRTRRGRNALAICSAAGLDVILTGHTHDAFARSTASPRRRLIQMGSGTLSTRIRATAASLCVVTLRGDRITRDVVTLLRNGSSIHRDFDSAANRPSLL